MASVSQRLLQKQLTKVSSVAAYSGHGVNRNGRAILSNNFSNASRAFGSSSTNNHGQNGSEGPRFGMGLGVFLATLASVTSVCTASIIDRKKHVYSWGFGQFGQLGHGGEKDEALPKAVEYLSNMEVAAVAAGGGSSAAVTSSGEVYTFGAGGDSRLGHGAGLDTPNQSVPRLVATLVGQNVVQVAIGEYHMAALTKDGKVYTWGKTKAPQLGHTNISEGLPNLVDLPEKIVKVACGRQQTVAVAESGRVYTWGIGYEGALGHGVRDNQRTPKLVVGEIQGRKIVNAACGREFTMVLDDAGQLHSWGANDYGQLGTGSVVRYVRAPAAVSALANRRIVALDCGEFHVAVLTDKGEVYTWGAGKDGQLGHDNREDISLPRLIPGLESKHIIQISCGGGHTSVLSKDGTLLTFGRGRNGQLGRGDQLESIAAYRTTPTPVESLSKRVEQVSCGSDHTIALVRSS